MNDKTKNTTENPTAKTKKAQNRYD